MALITIQYGSIASSETINKNFTYLEDKIAESSGSTMTSISSVLSNIATINSRLSDISEDILDINKKLESFKVKTKDLVCKSSMAPNWSVCYSVTLPYTPATNGYLLILPKADASGNIKINTKTIQFKLRSSSYDNAAQTIFIPVMAGDVISSAILTEVVYFIPAMELNFDDDEDSEESN